MRKSLCLIGTLVAVGLAAGCGNWFYKRPPVEANFQKVSTGMGEADVIKIFGKPTGQVEHELWYLYDDPTNPVRVRFVLDDKGLVSGKFYEPKGVLQERLKHAQETGPPPPEPLPGEEKRKYPGGPLDQFKDMNK